MILGIPREVKAEEYRVGLIPEIVAYCVKQGHQVLVETNAGLGAGFPDGEYVAAGGTIVTSPGDIFGRADIVIKVKEPQSSELALLREGQMLFTFFHFSSNPEMTRTLLRKKAACIAYELVEERGTLPILRPMSEIAGKLSIQEGMKYLEKEYGGKGILLSGVAGVRKGKVVILGGGSVGFNAARIATRISAEVKVLELNQERMEFLEEALDNVEVLYSNEENLRKSVRDADVVVGAVLTPGRKTPVLLRAEHLREMDPGAVLVDVSIDEGGVFESSRPTTHKQPVYLCEGIVHYCVPNIPGIVPRTSACALSYSTFPYLKVLLEKGEQAFAESPALDKGLALFRGQVRNRNLEGLVA